MAVPTQRFEPEYPKKIGDKVVRTAEEEYHHRQRLAGQQNEVESLKADVEYLNGLCASLNRTVETLKDVNAKLKAENDQLKARLASMAEEKK